MVQVLSADIKLTLQWQVTYIPTLFFQVILRQIGSIIKQKFFLDTSPRIFCENELGVACGTYGGRREMLSAFCGETRRKQTTWNVGTHGWLTLKWILMK
jgi:hypothetical protein